MKVERERQSPSLRRTLYIAFHDWKAMEEKEMKCSFKLEQCSVLFVSTHASKVHVQGPCCSCPLSYRIIPNPTHLSVTSENNDMVILLAFLRDPILFREVSQHLPQAQKRLVNLSTDSLHSPNEDHMFWWTSEAEAIRWCRRLKKYKSKDSHTISPFLVIRSRVNVFAPEGLLNQDLFCET